MTQALPIPDTPHIKRGRKFAAVIAGARQIFLRDGFDGASVDDIAKAAGVSKATLYAYVPDKRILFMEVASLECSNLSTQARDEIDMTAPPHVVLPQAAARIIGFISSPLGMGIYRLCVAESARFPALGQIYYQAGPMAARAALSEYLQGAVARGELAIDDLELAADQFGELCRTDLHARQLFGLAGPPSEAERGRVIDGAVSMFIARYAPSP